MCHDFSLWRTWLQLIEDNCYINCKYTLLYGRRCSGCCISIDYTVMHTATTSPFIASIHKLQAYDQNEGVLPIPPSKTKIWLRSSIFIWHENEQSSKKLACHQSQKTVLQTVQRLHLATSFCTAKLCNLLYLPLTCFPSLNNHRKELEKGYRNAEIHSCNPDATTKAIK